jgi:hypothetical protein
MSAILRARELIPITSGKNLERDLVMDNDNAKLTMLSRPGLTTLDQLHAMASMSDADEQGTRSVADAP